MKKQFKFILVLALAILSVLTCEARRYKFYTTISGACPIQLHVNGNRYWIATPSQKIELDLPNGGNQYSAVDAFGQNMQTQVFGNSEGGTVTVQIGGNSWANHGKRRLYEYRNGQIIELDYSSTSSNSTSDYASSYTADGDYDSRHEHNDALMAAAGGLGAAVIGGGLAAAISGGSTHCYPNFQLQVGASHMYSEFVRAKWMIGGGASMGLALYGGVGKEMIFDIKNEKMMDGYGKKRMPWHAGVGLFLITDSDPDNNSHDFTIGISYSESAAVNNGAVMFDLLWSKYFGSSKRFGIFIGGGLGFGDTKKKEPEFMWDATVGIALKLWQHN